MPLPRGVDGLAYQVGALLDELQQCPHFLVLMMLLELVDLALEPAIERLGRCEQVGNADLLALCHR